MYPQKLIPDLSADGLLSLDAFRKSTSKHRFTAAGITEQTAQKQVRRLQRSSAITVKPDTHISHRRQPNRQHQLKR